MKTNKVRQFVKIEDGRIGVVMANDLDGGVFRGHCDLWFGEMFEGVPVVEQLPVTDAWAEVECPIGLTRSDLEKRQAK